MLIGLVDVYTKSYTEGWTNFTDARGSGKLFREGAAAGVA